MLQTIRDRATGWFAYIIIGLLIIPFALWGINQYFGDSGTLEAAQVGDISISLREFQQAYQNQRQRLQGLLGNRFDPALFEGDRFKQEVLQGLINEKLLLQAASRLGLHVGDQQLTQVIQSLEAFQRNGAFDRDLYDQVLRTNAYSKAAFEANLRSSLATDQLRDGIVASAIVTPADIDRDVSLFNQQRELKYVVLSLASSLAKTTVDEAAVQAYYQAHKDRLLSPEQVQVQYLELKLEQMAEEVTVSEDELQAEYQGQKAKYSQLEERKASHILITVAPGASGEEVEEDRARAQAIYAEITSGAKSFAQAMQEAQARDAKDMQGGELGVISKGMMDPSFESALFGLKAPGDISVPIQTSFGFHIIRLDEIIAAQERSFAEVRNEVARELHLRLAEERFYEATESLANLSHEHPDSLEAAATALKLKIQESPWFTRQGGEGLAAYPKIIEAAFSEDVLTRGFNSEPIEIEPNHVVVIRVQTHKEAVQRSLDEAREDIVKQLRDDKAREAVQIEAEALQKRASQGEALQTLAQEFSGELKETGLVGRNDAAVDSAVLREAFRLPSPQDGKVSVGTTVLTNGDRAVITIARIVSGQDSQGAGRETLAQRMAEQVGGAQFQAFLAALRTQTQIVTYNDRL